MGLEYEEKIEVLFYSFERTLDYDIACLRADLTPEEQDRADNDETLHARIALCIADEKEALITNMRDLTKSNFANIKLRATIELGKIVYPEVFGDKAKGTEQPVNVNVYMRGKYPDNEDS